MIQRIGSVGGRAAEPLPQSAERRVVGDAMDALPDFDPISSADDEESTVVKADTPDKMKDITKPAEKTDESDPYGVKVRVTDAGHAVWNDMKHCIVAAPDGSLTIADRETGGDSHPVVNCVIKNNTITYHNPDPKGPKYLSCPLDPKGTELQLSDGTTVFVIPQEDGTCDVTITSVDPKVPTDGKDPHPGVMTTFKGLGSGKPFELGKNPTGAETGGAEFKRKWEQSHSQGGKSGTLGHLWVTPITAPKPDSPYSAERHYKKSRDKADPNTDFSQQPGGISKASDKRYDLNKHAGKNWCRLWFDLGGTDATKPDGSVEKLEADIAKLKKDGAWYLAQADSPDLDKNQMNKDIVTALVEELKDLEYQLARAKANASAGSEVTSILDRSASGQPLFDTPENPDVEESIFGDGSVSGGKKPSGAKGDDPSDNDDGTSSGSSSSGGFSLADLFASQMRNQLESAAERKRREEQRALAN